MAKYAFRDEEKTDKVCAAKFLKESLRTCYFCPGEGCDAHMQLRERDGVSLAYFSALPKYPHVRGCSFAASNNFNREKYIERDFDFNCAMDALFSPTKSQKRTSEPSSHNTGESKPHPLRTLREIYSMCKVLKVKDTYNNIVVGQMLLDDRSKYMYPKGVFGNRIIEGKRGNKYYYYSATLELRITAPIKEGKYTFSLQFNNRELWREIKNHLFNNPDCIVVVAGEWKPTSTFNTFRSAITSKKQIYTNAKLRFVERR